MIRLKTLNLTGNFLLTSSNQIKDFDDQSVYLFCNRLIDCLELFTLTKQHKNHYLYTLKINQIFNRISSYLNKQLITFLKISDVSFKNSQTQFFNGIIQMLDFERFPNFLGFIVNDMLLNYFSIRKSILLKQITSRINELLIGYQQTNQKNKLLSFVKNSCSFLSDLATNEFVLFCHIFNFEHDELA